MTAFIDLTTALLIFLAYGAFAFGLAVLLGKCIAYGQRDFEDHGRERVGLSEPTSISAYVDEREARVSRAKFRHSTRHGNAA